MRYYGQEHTVKVPLPSGRIDDEEVKKIIERFHEYHEREYAFRLDSPVEIVNFHLVGEYRVKKFELKELNNIVSSLDDAIMQERRIYVNGNELTVPVYSKQKLSPRFRIDGPAIIEDPTSTILVLSSQKAIVDKYGNVNVLRGE
jgi:N-methylhydantoinase A